MILLKTLVNKKYSQFNQSVIAKITWSIVLFLTLLIKGTICRKVITTQPATDFVL